MPWSRLSARVAVPLGLFLLPFVIDSAPFAFGVILQGAYSDVVLFVLRSRWDGLVLSFSGRLVLLGSLWLWFRHTRFPKRCYEAWRMP